MERGHKISEEQARITRNCSCMDRVYTLGKIVKGGNEERRTT